MSDALPVIESHLASGEGWVISRGRDSATGAARLVVTLAPADVAEVRRVLAVAGSPAGSVAGPVAGPTGGAQLVAPIGVVARGDSLGLLVAPPGGPSLAQIVAERSSLSAGETVTLVAPLSALLATLHGRGVALAAVDANCVWLTRDGRPALLPVVSTGSPDGTDVRALARLVADVLDRSSEGADVVGAALDAAAAGRLDAQGLATRLVRATRALPVATDAAPMNGRRSLLSWAGRARLGRARLGRARVGQGRPMIALVVVALVAVVVGGLWGRQGDADTVLAAPPLPERVTETAPSPPAPSPSWPSVMAHLERARARAFSTGDTGWLEDVYAPGSAVGAADRRLLGGLVEHRQRATGLRAFVQRVVVIASSESRATLRVTDALTAYDVTGPDGRVVRHGAGRPGRGWRVTLVRTPDGWRIWSVSGQ